VDADAGDLTDPDMSDQPVIIEVALNGQTTKTANPAAPETAEELVADALDCLAAGASIVHAHQPSGPRSRPASERYAAAFGPAVRTRSDAIMYPTIGGGGTIAERYDHHIALAEAGLIRMGVVDPGSVNLAATAMDGTPPDSGFVYVNSPADIHYMLAVCGSYRIGPNFAIYEPGFLRVVVAYHRAGCLPAGSLTKLYFSQGGYFGGGQPLFSAPPIPEALDLYLAMLRDTRLPWSVTVLGGSLLDSPVALLALQRGGHLRVGLEDFGSGPANVEQVRRAVALCAEVGRPVASCAAAADILGLPDPQ
jgi:3-keto-5-aminohexanoate cleavage enzyme